MGSEDAIEVKCPICERTHKFPLQIEYSMVMHLMTGSAERDNRRRRRTFERWFTCPSEGGRFSGTVVLFESSLAPIEKVEVDKAIDPDDDDHDE